MGWLGHLGAQFKADRPKTGGTTGRMRWSDSSGRVEGSYRRFPCFNGISHRKLARRVNPVGKLDYSRVDQLRVLRDRIVASVRHQQHFGIESFGDKARLGDRVRPVLILLAHDDERRGLHLIETSLDRRVAGAGGLDERPPVVAVAHTLPDPLLVLGEVSWWPTGVGPTVVGVPGCRPPRLYQHQPIGKRHQRVWLRVPDERADQR